MELLYLFIGLVLGFSLAYLFLKMKFGVQFPESQSDLYKNTIEEWKEKLNKQEIALENERKINLELNRQVAGQSSDLRNLKEKLDKQKKDLTEVQEKLSLQFSHLANRIFEEKSQKFSELNEKSLKEILNPLGEKIISFERKVEETNKEHIERNSALKEQLLNLKEMNQKITKEANNLTQALKGDSKMQGNWGEMILERILEASGLVKGREYRVQESFSTEEGKRLQPDVIVDLPEDKCIIIDSKVSLTAFERYVNANSEAEQEEQLKMHILSVKTHLKQLSEKKYQAKYDVKGLDFVLMFIPVESAFSTVVMHQENIFMEAYSKNIVLVSPTTLIATLRTIASIWKNEYQNRNALEIAKQSSDLYDKFVGFTEDLMGIGKSLSNTQKAYDDAMNKLKTGKGNLIGRTEKLRKLGISPSKRIDRDLLE